MARKAQAVTQASAASPFKTLRTKKKATAVPPAKSLDKAVTQSVDEFKTLYAEIKKLEGELAIRNAKLKAFAVKTFAEQQVKGVDVTSFYIAGETETVQYIAQNLGAGLTEEDCEQFAHNFGADAAKALLKRDIGSIRFNTKVVNEEVLAQIAEALGSLPQDLLDTIFTPATFGVVPGVYEKARQFAKSPAQYSALVQSLKLKNYIKA